MASTRWLKPVSKWIAVGIGAAAASYGMYAWVACRRYDRQRVTSQDGDALLDRFIPEYDVVEHHRVPVEAPADVTLAAATDIDPLQSPIVRAIFKARQILMGGTVQEQLGSKSLQEQVQNLGWGILAEIPGREIVFGAVTQPWVANVVFRAFPPEEFADFREPGFVKIVWTLRADPGDAHNCVFSSETRVATTDLNARVSSGGIGRSSRPGLFSFGFSSCERSAHRPLVHYVPPDRITLQSKSDSRCAVPTCNQASRDHTCCVNCPAVAQPNPSTVARGWPTNLVLSRRATFGV